MRCYRTWQWWLSLEQWVEEHFVMHKRFHLSSSYLHLGRTSFSFWFLRDSFFGLQELFFVTFLLFFHERLDENSMYILYLPCPACWMFNSIQQRTSYNALYSIQFNWFNKFQNLINITFHFQAKGIHPNAIWIEVGGYLLPRTSDSEEDRVEGFVVQICMPTQGMRLKHIKQLEGKWHTEREKYICLMQDIRI